jgi:putative PIN family toxin of toxin-antitoxin system
MLRVLIDTNTVVSALIWSGTPEAVIRVTKTQGGVLLSSRDLLNELEATLNKPKLRKPLALASKTPALVVEEFQKLVEIVETAEIRHDAVRDPNDLRVLAAAVGGRATHIVSGDRDLTDLQSFAGIYILTPRAFIETFAPPTPT